MATNLTTYELSDAAVTARDAQYPGTPLTDTVGLGTYVSPYLGMNRGGSNAPGIGINTGTVLLTAAEIAAGETRPDNWTLLDQAGAARVPQDSQHIGGIIGAAPAYAGTEYPTPAQAGSTAVKIADLTVGAVDVNNTANLIITDTAAVDGAVMDVSSGAINDTGATVGIGDLVWGQVPVA